MIDSSGLSLELDGQRGRQARLPRFAKHDLSHDDVLEATADGLVERPRSLVDTPVELAGQQLVKRKRSLPKVDAGVAGREHVPGLLSHLLHGVADDEIASGDDA